MPAGLWSQCTRSSVDVWTVQLVVVVVVVVVVGVVVVVVVVLTCAGS